MVCRLQPAAKDLGRPQIERVLLTVHRTSPSRLDTPTAGIYKALLPLRDFSASQATYLRPMRIGAGDTSAFALRHIVARDQLVASIAVDVGMDVGVGMLCRHELFHTLR